MLTYLRTLFATVVMAPLSIVSAAAAAPSDATDAWVVATRENTIAAYANFAMSYPDSAFAKEARKRISGQQASPEGTALPSQAYLSPGRTKTMELVPDIIRIS